MMQFKLPSIMMYPRNFIGYYYKVGNRIKEYRSTTKISSVTNIPLSLRYDGFLHLPQLQILLPPPIVRYINIHGFVKEATFISTWSTARCDRYSMYIRILQI